MKDCGSGRPEVFWCLSGVGKDEFNEMLRFLGERMHSHGYVLSTVSEDEADEDPAYWAMCQFE
jgi:hypothetical protein